MIVFVFILDFLTTLIRGGSLYFSSTSTWKQSLILSTTETNISEENNNKNIIYHRNKDYYELKPFYISLSLCYTLY